jgi:YD repeat-containing protein
MAAWTFTYDPAGNRQTIFDSLGNATTYVMDAKNQLLQSNKTGPAQAFYIYSYDAVDNRLTSNELGRTATWAYDLSGRILTQQNYQAASTTYTYSPNGNTIGVNDPSSGLTTMAYDWENRLSVHENGVAVASYLYYTDNMKAVENIGGVLTTVIWDGSSYLQGRS